MNLMTPQTGSKLRPAIASTHTVVETITYATDECALGHALVARSIKGVCAILMGDNRKDLETDLAARFPSARLVANRADVDDDMTKVIQFVDKPVEELHLLLDMRGTPFQRLVWEKIRAIPAGRTVTYTELAHWAGPLTSPRAVAGACASNPIVLAVPCHSIVGSKGDLTGYRWRVERKRELIRKEGMA